MNSRNLIIAAALAAAPVAAYADGDLGDIAVRIADGRIETSLVADADGDLNSFNGPQERVFVADLDEFEDDGDVSVFSPPPGGLPNDAFYVTNTPGFDSDEGTFAPGAFVGLDVVTDAPALGDNLALYNPATNAIEPTAVELQASFASDVVRTDGSFGGGPLFLPAFQSGSWHRHYVFAAFDGLDPQTGDLTPPPTGVYILEAELATQQPGVLDSDPIYVVFGVGANDAEIDAAVDFLEANVIPEPAAASLLAVAGGLVLRRRR